MSDLSASSRALLDAARGARMSTEERARMRARLGERLALTAAATAAATAVARSSAVAGASTAPAATAGAAGAAAKLGGMGILGKIFLACVMAGAVGLGGRAVLGGAAARSAGPGDSHAAAIDGKPGDPGTQAPGAVTGEPAAASAEPAAGSAEPVAASAQPETPSVAGDPPAPPPSAAPAPLKRGAPRPRASSDAVSIAAEVALLREAQAALAEGNGSRSLEAIDALAARHPDGALREERDAARVLALCAAGRVDEARAQARRFLAQTPRSAQAARVRGSCAFNPVKMGGDPPSPPANKK